MIPWQQTIAHRKRLKECGEVALAAERRAYEVGTYEAWWTAFRAWSAFNKLAMGRVGSAPVTQGVEGHSRVKQGSEGL